MPPPPRRRQRRSAGAPRAPRRTPPGDAARAQRGRHRSPREAPAPPLRHGARCRLHARGPRTKRRRAGRRRRAAGRRLVLGHRACRPRPRGAGYHRSRGHKAPYQPRATVGTVALAIACPCARGSFAFAGHSGARCAGRRSRMARQLVQRRVIAGGGAGWSRPTKTGSTRSASDPAPWPRGTWSWRAHLLPCARARAGRLN